jgi:hypothetical protein
MKTLEAGPYGGREKRGKWEELGFFSLNGFAFLIIMEGVSMATDL